MNNVSVLYFMTTGWNCPACHGFKNQIKAICGDMNVPLFIVDISKDSIDPDTNLNGVEEGTRYNICGLPTVVVLHDGEEVGRIDSGVTKQGVIDLIKSARDD